MSAAITERDKEQKKAKTITLKSETYLKLQNTSYVLGVTESEALRRMTWWTGLPDDWNFEFRILTEDDEKSERLKIKSRMIADLKPYLQETANGRFKRCLSSYYTRNDLCIYPWHGQRRDAFEYRLSLMS